MKTSELLDDLVTRMAGAVVEAAKDAFPQAVLDSLRQTIADDVHARLKADKKFLLLDREAAKLLNISVSTLRREASEGKVTPIKVRGSLPRWTAAELERYAAEQQRLANAVTAGEA